MVSQLFLLCSPKTKRMIEGSDWLKMKQVLKASREKISEVIQDLVIEKEIPAPNPKEEKKDIVPPIEEDKSQDLKK